jgi:hypothetical protein
MNCPSCGAEIAAGGTFCGRCGTRMEAAPASAHSIRLDADGQGTGCGYNLAALAGLLKPFFPSQGNGGGFKVNLGG